MTTPQSTYTLRDGIMTLDEDISKVGRAFYSFLIILLGSLAVRIQTHNDATLLIKTVGWLILGPTLLWFLYLVLWRKQVVLDFNKNEIRISFGPLVFLFNNTYKLSNFKKLEIVTREDHTSSVENAPRSRSTIKITKTFFLHGKAKIHIATRCFEKSDYSRDMSIRKLEHEIRQHIEG